MRLSIAGCQDKVNYNYINFLIVDLVLSELLFILVSLIRG